RGDSVTQEHRERLKHSFILLKLLHKLAGRAARAVMNRLVERGLAEVATQWQRVPQSAALFDQIQLLKRDAALFEAALDRAPQAGRIGLGYYLARYPAGHRPEAAAGRQRHLRDGLQRLQDIAREGPSLVMADAEPQLPLQIAGGGQPAQV